MSTFSSRLAARMLRWWVRLYTAGLSASEKSERRDEIDSNHYEHTHDADAAGPGHGGARWQVLGRMLRGLPGDVTWRLSRQDVERRAARGGLAVAGRGGGVIALVAYRSYIGVAAAAFALVLMVGLIVGVVLIDRGGFPAVNRIAFQSFRSGSWDVFVMSADGADQTRLTRGPRTEMFPALSPDGKQIAFAANLLLGSKSDLFVMEADGTNMRQLTDTSLTQELDPAWSPDGRKIAFTVQEGEGVRSRRIYVMDADGKNKTRLTSNEDGEEIPTWSPDGRRVAFSASLDDGNWDIYVIDLNGTDQMRLTTTPGDDAGPAWSPDGTKIAFLSIRDGHYEIYVMKRDGSDQTRLTDNPQLSQLSYVSWSPDGRLIAFVSTRDGNSEIYTIDVETGEETRITSDPAADVWPSWR